MVSQGRETRWVKLRRVGNSLVVTVPRDEVSRLGLHEGDLVTVQVRPLDVRPRDDADRPHPE